MGAKSVDPSSEHQALHGDLMAALRKHEDLPALELLAVTANLVGKLIAMQDQRKYTMDALVAMVSRNIDQGNAEACAQVKGAAAGSA